MVQFTDDYLGRIARTVIARVRPRPDVMGDCFQTAYLAGLSASASAARNNSPLSGQLIFSCMRQSVYRMLNKRREIREADFSHAA